MIDHMFSAKPKGGYHDYHQKFTAYVGLISKPLVAVGRSPNARTFRLIQSEAGDGPFEYMDTATPRSAIGHASDRLRGQTIAVVGVGGTGSYILDFLAKTPVDEIHLFDDDAFRQHNAFRTPGTASLQDLERGLPKVRYLAEQYGRMHRGVVPHEVRVDADLVALGDVDPDFVFLCVDSDARTELAKAFAKRAIPFVDTGLGLSLADDGQLQGIVRISSWRPGENELGPQHIPATTPGADLYESNIQIAELNALAAFYAVAVWKRHLGFYVGVDTTPMYGFLVDQLRPILALPQ